MDINLYQQLAARTINMWLDADETEMHALHGMASEIGELHGIYQKFYQGHVPEDNHIKKELGDIMWFIAEYCTCKGWDLDDICDMNIKKLEARYPAGFFEDRSLHRADGDI